MDDEIRNKLMQVLAAGIDDVLTKVLGDDTYFTLIIFTTQGEALNYISNTARSDAILALREVADALEKATTTPLGATIQ